MLIALLASIYPASQELALGAPVPASAPAMASTRAPVPTQAPASARAPAAAEPAWSASISTFYMSPPHADDYLSAILYADRGQLHLEARWAYEDRDTASLFGGWSLPVEGDIHGQAIPMLGFASGDTDGIVPAVSLALEWSHLRFTTDAEYLIGTSSGSQDFFYSWSELTWAFSDKFSAGLVGQRTNVFDQELTVDRGFLVSMALGPTRGTIYYFNPDQGDPYVTIGVGANF